MIELRDATLTNALPGIVGTQPWVKALAAAWQVMQNKTLDLADKSQFFTAIDTASEQILDALAVQFRVEWYRTDYSLEVKRQLIKSALDVWRTMGTIYAVRTAIAALSAGTVVEEWFEYGGEPGYFRVFVDISAAGDDAKVITSEGIVDAINRVKRWSTKLEAVNYTYESRPAELKTGACTAALNRVEIWPELVETLDFTATAASGGAMVTQQRLEVYPAANY